MNPWAVQESNLCAQKVPSALSIENNAHVMARYASVCQVHGLVPIVEPDIDVVQGDHSLEKAQQVSEKVLSAFFKVLQDYDVYLEGIVLKTSMSVPGKKANKSATPQDIAKATVLALSRTVPPAVPGVAFLSGGQTEEQVRDVVIHKANQINPCFTHTQAASYLNAINKEAKEVFGKQPWRLTYSYGRAFQASALKAWSNDDSKAQQVQQTFAKVLKNGSLASMGEL